MLTGPERLVLQAVNGLPKDQYGNVQDEEIVSDTGLALFVVVASLESLHGEGLVSRTRLADRHLAAQITARGTLELSQGSPSVEGDDPRLPESRQVKVVPKGLRSFDAEDKDFFLELLPGPRRGDGLPESVHFWKVRIEEMDPDKTFKVGVIFGPSGCGKSSLVKAGLLPTLSDSVITVYLEASENETGIRLLKGLRKHFPDLPADLDLPETLREILARSGCSPKKKVVIILDQFEQWLQSNRGEEEPPLAQVLSQCDGERVQAILMIRDDFWMAMTRFMGNVGVELHQWQNFAAVDLFDLQHARKVLTAFGQAFGALPDRLVDLSDEQRTFLDRTVGELAQDGKIISVRLALLVEMVKSKPWTPATLKEMGGTAGVGVRFLEEVFASKALQRHEKAARGALKVLLPESGLNIKGHMRSHEELLKASGYVGHPKDFEHLLRILDNVVRLITPTDPEGTTDNDDREGPAIALNKYYHLTHDYLVPSIREWLTRKQKETRRGRAELRLAERSSLWNAKPENRLLPSLLEWANIRLLTKKRDWTEPQRRMMQQAGWVHGTRTLAAVVVLGLLTWGGIEEYGNLQAAKLVDKLATADTADVPAIIKELSKYRRWADPRLKRLVQSTDDTSLVKLHGSLALLPVDPSYRPFLEKRLLSAAPAEFPVIRDALEPQCSTLTPKLWTVLESAKPGDSLLLPSASALATYNPDNH